MVPASSTGNSTTVADTLDRVTDAAKQQTIGRQWSIPLHGLLSGGQQSCMGSAELSTAESAAEPSCICTRSAACILNAAMLATGSRTTEIAIRAANMARTNAMVRMVPDMTRHVHGQVTISRA